MQKKMTTEGGTSVSQHLPPFVCDVLPPNTTYIKLLLPSQTFVLCSLQRYADIFNHFLCLLAGWNYFTLRLLHGGEGVQLVQSNYMTIVLTCCTSCLSSSPAAR